MEETDVLVTRSDPALRWPARPRPPARPRRGGPSRASGVRFSTCSPRAPTRSSCNSTARVGGATRASCGERGGDRGCGIGGGPQRRSGRTPSFSRKLACTDNAGPNSRLRARFDTPRLAAPRHAAAHVSTPRAARSSRAPSTSFGPGCPALYSARSPAPRPGRVMRAAPLRGCLATRSGSCAPKLRTRHGPASGRGGGPAPLSG